MDEKHSSVADEKEHVQDARFEEDSEEFADKVVIIKNFNYVRRNEGVVVGDHVDAERIDLHKESHINPNNSEDNTNRPDIFENGDTLSEWITQHYGDFEMAFLITVAVYDNMPSDWIYELAEELFLCTKIEKEDAEVEKNIKSARKRVEELGCVTYESYIYDHTGRIPCQFIGFQSREYGIRVLECIWKEFLYYRKILTGWLMKHVYEKNFSKSEKAMETLAALAAVDFYYFDKNMIRMFWNKKNLVADLAIAWIMVTVHKDRRYQRNVETQFKHWNTLGNFHGSVIALMMCMQGGWSAEKVYDAVSGYLENALAEMSGRDEQGYCDGLPVFFVIGDRKAIYYKAIVQILHEKLSINEQSKYYRKAVGRLFFALLQIDDAQSKVQIQGKNKDMIFVKMCLIKNGTAPKIAALWRYLWVTREFHRDTKQFLERYLYQYGGCGEETIAYLRQFLFSFQQSDEERAAMDYFLKKIAFKYKHPVREAARIGTT